jgi:long-chain acyl-CoA synthetase
MTQDPNKAIYEARPWIKWYLPGVEPDVKVKEESVVDTFNETTEQWKDKTAVVFYGRKMSYKELREQVDRFATALVDLGVKKGDKIALLLLNSPQFIIAYMGALKAGATLTAISPVYVSSEIKYQIEDSGARMIVCLDILYDNVEKKRCQAGCCHPDQHRRIPAFNEEVYGQHCAPGRIPENGRAACGTV